MANNIFNFLDRKAQPDPPPKTIENPPDAESDFAELREKLETAGRDLGRNTLKESMSDKEHLKQVARGLIDDLWRPYDPAKNPVDRKLPEKIEALIETRAVLQEDHKTAAALRRKLEAELPPPPPVYHASAVVIATAVCVYMLGFGASILPIFSDIDDPVLGWAFALAIGACMGLLIVYAVISIDE